MTPERVGLAVASGLSIVCGTCVKYWRARDAGVPGDACLSTTGCGSPLAGKAFHDYEGPMRDFETWCFVCGQRSSYAARHDRSGKLFGLCASHVAYLRDLRRPVSGPESVVTAGGGRLLPVEDLIGRRKKTLLEVIAETEADWKEKSGV